MRRYVFSLFLVVFALGVPAAAMTIDLNNVEFPDRKTIDLRMDPRAGAPEATLNAKVTFRDGQANVEMNFANMKPAILFGGDITCYVVWAVTRDGQATNLGELLTPTPKGKVFFSTGQKNFALLVTAEPYYLVGKPAALPVFINEALDKKKISTTSFGFSGFREPTPKRAMESITAIAWDSKTPLELLQARKAFEQAGEADAETHARDLYTEASEALQQAEAQFDKAPGSKKITDLARRSVALSTEAINISVHRLEGIKIEQQIARRRAEMAELEQRATEAVAAAELAAAQTDELNRQKETLELEMGGLLEEKQELGSMLEEALAHVAATQSTARGYVINLPDILFDLDQATLKPQAEVTIAKLAGILLVMKDFSVAIEGHTDSTGSAEYNLQLSERRAESVKEFMTAQGIDAERLTAVGFGMERPVADNATEAGRSKNRRVEIVLSGT